MGEFSGWTPEAIAVAQRSMARHGREAWARGGTLSFRLASPWIKGVGRTFPLPGRVEWQLETFRTVFRDYPRQGERGEFDSGRVRLFGSDGAVLLDSPRHRETFRGLRKWRRWTPADALYFFGYAVSYYHSMPFLFGGLRLVRLRTERGLTALTVQFPAEIHTHCPIQTFFLDETGLIVHHDYTAEIVGNWATGRHRWQRYQDVGGLMVATTRHVNVLLGGVSLQMTALHADLVDWRLENASVASVGRR